jgi:hypothetical protein
VGLGRRPGQRSEPAVSQDGVDRLPCWRSRRAGVEVHRWKPERSETGLLPLKSIRLVCAKLLEVLHKTQYFTPEVLRNYTNITSVSQTMSQADCELISARRIHFSGEREGPGVSPVRNCSLNTAAFIQSFQRNCLSQSTPWM